uniref:snRNA-activating protein complex subunit 4-like isoform X1 n=2 Tax=Petromyzon marinus TaxID=7757 RepID=A0AAJ7SMD9_PETMA|nr:snRNA-activating protein complex subunit 4-like isoform X1 [Petromyzon marinus]
MSYQQAAEERERIRREIEAIERSLLERGVRIPSSGSEPGSTSDSCEETREEGGGTDFLQRISDFDATNVTLHQLQVGEVDAGSDSSEEDDGLLPQDAPTCLSINLLYQELLQERLRDLDGLLQQNWDQQEALKRESLDRDLASGMVRSAQKHLHLGSFLKPYFRDTTSGLGPPDNPETKNMTSCGHKNFTAYDLRRWTEREKESLRQAVLMDSLQSRLQPLVTRLNTTEVKMERMGEDEDKSAIISSIDLMKQDINRVKNLPENELMGDKDDRHDWLKIANFDMAGKRSPTEVEKFWRYSLHPGVNATTWQSHEDKALHKLVSQHGHNAWGDIASRLGTNRTAFQCLSRFQRTNRAFRRKEWTEGENEALIQLVEAMRIGEHIPFTRIAFFMDGRSPAQLSGHWNNVLKPGLRHGAWSSLEDDLLLRAVERFGERWFLVAKEVPGRTDLQCRERYVNCLADGLAKGMWSNVEDKNLQSLVNYYGPGQWSVVAKALGTRSNSQCSKRWKRLNEKQSPRVDSLSRKRKNSTSPTLDGEGIPAVKIRRAGRRKTRWKRHRSVYTISTPPPSPPPSSLSSSPSPPPPLSSSSSVEMRSDSDGDAHEADDVVDASNKRKITSQHHEDKRAKLLPGGAAGSSTRKTTLCVPSIDLWLHPNPWVMPTTSDPAAFQENDEGTQLREVSEPLGPGRVWGSRGPRGRGYSLDHKISLEMKKWSHLAATVSHTQPESQTTVESQDTAAKLTTIEEMASVEETAAAPEATAAKGKTATVVCKSHKLATSSRSLADVLGEKMGHLNLKTKSIFELLLQVFAIDRVGCLRMINEKQLGLQMTKLPCLRTAKATLTQAGVRCFPQRQSVRDLLARATSISQQPLPLILTPIAPTSLRIGQGGSPKPISLGAGNSSNHPFTFFLPRPLVPSRVSDGTPLSSVVSGGSTVVKPTSSARSPVKPGTMVFSLVGGIPVISSLGNASNVPAESVVKPLVAARSPIPHASGITPVPPGSVVMRPAITSGQPVCSGPSVTAVFTTIVTTPPVGTRPLVYSPATAGSAVTRVVNTRALVTSLLNAELLVAPPLTTRLAVKPLVTTGPIVTPISTPNAANTTLISRTTPATTTLASGTTPACKILISGTTAITSLTSRSSSSSTARMFGIPSPASMTLISGTRATSAILVSGSTSTTSTTLASRTPSSASALKEAWLLFGGRDERSETPGSVWSWGRVPPLDDDDDDEDEEDGDDKRSIETWMARLNMRGSSSDPSLTASVACTESFPLATSVASPVAASMASTAAPSFASTLLASVVNSSPSSSLPCAVISSISRSLVSPALASASSLLPSVTSSLPLVVTSLPSSVSSPPPSFTSMAASSLPSPSYPLPSVTSSLVSSITSSLSSSLPPLSFPPAPPFSAPLPPLSSTPPCSYLPPCVATLRALKTLLQRRQTLLLQQQKQQQQPQAQHQPPLGELSNVNGNTTTTAIISSGNNVDNNRVNVSSPSPMAPLIKEKSPTVGIEGGVSAGNSLPFSLGAVDSSQNFRQTDHCLDRHQSQGPLAPRDRQWREGDISYACLRRRFLATFTVPAILATTPLLCQDSEFFRRGTRPSDQGREGSIRGRGRGRGKGRGRGRRKVVERSSMDDGGSNFDVRGVDDAEVNGDGGRHGAAGHSPDCGQGRDGVHVMGGDICCGEDEASDGGSSGKHKGESVVKIDQSVEAVGNVGIRGRGRPRTRGRGRVRVRGGKRGRQGSRDGVGSEVQLENVNI